jgi:hypothetical protein
MNLSINKSGLVARPNVINYGLFAVIYGTQLPREKRIMNYGIIHRYIFFFLGIYIQLFTVVCLKVNKNGYVSRTGHVG